MMKNIKQREKFFGGRMKAIRGNIIKNLKLETMEKTKKITEYILIEMKNRFSSC